MRRVDAAAQEACSSSRGRDFQELLAAQSPFHILLLVHFLSLLLPLVAGRTDDPHHLCEVLAGIRNAVRRRAAVVDAVAALELEELAAELELDTPRQYDEQLFGVPMGIRMLAGRATDLELAREDLEVAKRR